jgi:acyl-coenzyme A synthetase/AMP-(fatty) acid ligase
LFKVAGQWVSPGEIEEIAATEDGVLDAALVGVSDSDGLLDGVLFVVPREAGARGIPSRLERALADRLPPHKRPRRIEVVPEIPRTATGKIQRFKLRQLAAVG